MAYPARGRLSSLAGAPGPLRTQRAVSACRCVLRLHSRASGRKDYARPLAGLEIAAAPSEEDEPILLREGTNLVWIIQLKLRQVEGVEVTALAQRWQKGGTAPAEVDAATDSSSRS